MFQKISETIQIRLKALSIKDFLFFSHGKIRLLDLKAPLLVVNIDLISIIFLKAIKILENLQMNDSSNKLIQVMRYLI